ncbi:Electron transfer flavoprotein, alpha subunit [Caballeronia sordidicola]|uniref:Electron transfer flavoprotein, alpha subunit n=1 Tax=Caballeronia sordidicola TaxID=196367 RepID=A0A2C9XV52_CABSO|nr:Electron transfer flavoprotein, alpha subunit [Caballeronia sordidicola]
MAAEGGSALAEKIEALADTGISKLMSRELMKPDRPEPTSAKIIVLGGRCLGKGESYSKERKPLEDNSVLRWVSPLRQPRRGYRATQQRRFVAVNPGRERMTRS